MVEKCGAKEGANQEEIETTIAKKSPTTQAGKCIQACLAETANMVNINKLRVSKVIGPSVMISSILIIQLGSDLKLNVEKTIQMAGMAFDFDPNVIEATRLMADACKDVTGRLEIVEHFYFWNFP